MKKISPFSEVIKLITSKEEIEVNNEFIVNRILSFQPSNVLWSIELNKYIGRIPRWASKRLLNIGVYKEVNSPWLIYPKKEKNKLKDILLQRKICKHFFVNRNHAKQIIELLRNLGKKPEIFFGLKKGE